MPTLAFGPEGRLLLTGGTDAVARLWRVEGMQPLLRLEGHEKTIYGSAMHPTGRLAATACSAGRVCIWDVATGDRLHTIEAGGRVNELAFSELGALLYGSGRTGVHVWETKTGAARPNLPGYEGVVVDLALHTAGHTLAAVGAEGAVRVWSLPAGELSRTLTPEGEEATCVALHPERPLLAAGTKRGSLVLWDLESGAELSRVAAHEGYVYGVSFDPAGRVLASGGRDQLARLWNVGPRAR